MFGLSYALTPYFQYPSSTGLVLKLFIMFRLALLIIVIVACSAKLHTPFAKTAKVRCSNHFKLILDFD